MIALLTVTDPLLAVCINYSLQMVILQYLSQNNNTHTFTGALQLKPTKTLISLVTGQINSVHMFEENDFIFNKLMKY